jgi:hypothetical protein
MRGILADHDVEGVLEVLGYVWFSPEWRDIFVEFGLSIEYFHSVGLAAESSDREV